MMNCFTRQKLDLTIKLLGKKRDGLRHELDSVLEELHECYEAKAMIDGIETVSVRFGDLLEELKFVSGYDITNIKFNALTAFAKADDIEETNREMKFFGSDLRIDFGNEKFIFYVFNTFSGYIFGDLSDIQADGKTLLEHCSFENNGTKNLVVDKNIDDVICRFDLKKTFSWDASVDNDGFLEQAVYSLIRKKKVVSIEYFEKEKQKSLGSR